MTDKEKIKELLEASSDGTITAEQVTAAGLHRSILRGNLPFWARPVCAQQRMGR